MRPVSRDSSCLLVPKAGKTEKPSSVAGAQGPCGGKTCSFESCLWVEGTGKAPGGFSQSVTQEPCEQQGVMFMCVGGSPSLTTICSVDLRWFGCAETQRVDLSEPVSQGLGRGEPAALPPARRARDETRWPRSCLWLAPMFN